MSEHDTIQHTSEPLTTGSLAAQLAALGLHEGQTVLVHTALSRIGWVVGGAEALIRALLAVLGADGTLMMPAHSTGNTDPATWEHPPVPEAWWPVIRAHMPPFDPATTPTRGLGVTPELFRTFPNVRRSQHPITSFAAFGRSADELTRDHHLNDEMGERSPVGRLYALDGYVLLLGVGHGNNSSLHLAEYRAEFPGKRWKQAGCAMQVDGRRQWVTFETLDINDVDFAEIGRAFDAAHPVTVGRVGQAEARLFSQRAAVDFAVAWMNQHRDFSD